MSEWDSFSDRELEEEMASLRAWMARANLDAEAREAESVAAAAACRAARTRSMEIGNRLAEIDRVLYERVKAEVSAALAGEEPR